MRKKNLQMLYKYIYKTIQKGNDQQIPLQWISDNAFTTFLICWILIYQGGVNCISNNPGLIGSLLPVIFPEFDSIRKMSATSIYNIFRWAKHEEAVPGKLLKSAHLVSFLSRTCTK